jgi:hypothetical protein
MNGWGRSRWVSTVFAIASLSATACHRPEGGEGERLARRYCAACHAFPEPQLLDKQAWRDGVLPQMAPRMGVGTALSLDAGARNPYLRVLKDSASEQTWAKIVRYYLEAAPETLAYQSLPAQPALDPDFFQPRPFDPQLRGSGIITLLQTDTTRERVFVGEAGTNSFRIFDWDRRLLSSLALESPPTDLIVEGNHVLILESGILDPNDHPRGRLARYDFVGPDSLQFRGVVVDSLFRPVFVRQLDFDGDGRNDFLICEYGNNRGRLALYRRDASGYRREVIDSTPGAIRFEIREMTGDDSPDIVALIAQGDERLVLFENDGKGRFSNPARLLARFPPVYGSMYFSMHDFNGDGRLDIVYVNGDNFDFSRVLKPYHGVRILENDGENVFRERFFFPVYGAARAEVADFDKDGDPDVLTTSTFADRDRHPERGIMYLENSGGYAFRPHAFTIALRNRWNLTATADVNRDGRLDVLIAAMDLENVAALQRGKSGRQLGTERDPLLVFENRMGAMTP